MAGKKPMTFEEAEAKLLLIAKGRYCGLRKYHYENAIMLSEDYPEWSIWLDGHVPRSHRGHFWDECLEKARKEALAPDKDKLCRFADALLTVQNSQPILKSSVAKDLISQAILDIQDTAETLRKRADEL